MDGMKQATAPAVPARATRGAETRWSWVEASVWTEHMVSALDNGVKGSRLVHFTLARRTLRAGRAARTPHSLAHRETLPMRKLPTGEPYAGKPPVRFGGRGGPNPSRPLSPSAWLARPNFHPSSAGPGLRL